MPTRLLKATLRVSKENTSRPHMAFCSWLVRCWLPMLLLTGLVDMPVQADQADNIEIRVEPTFRFLVPILDNTYDTLEAAFAAAKAAWDNYPIGSHRVSTVVTNLYPQPGVQIWNGIPTYHYSVSTTCLYDGTCFLDSGPNIVTQMFCPGFPINTTGLALNLDPIFRQWVCRGSIPSTEPCNDCDAKGNPIHPSTGQKLQVETDYASPSGGLQFTRTYRSSNGYFTSPATATFIDNTLARTTSGCLQGTYDAGHYGVYSHCFPYVTDGTQTYRLFTPEGRHINLSGAANAVAAKADVNIKVSQRSNAAGALEWVIQQEDNSTEIYSAQGLLLRKTSLGGSPDITYSYSDTSTPLGIAPRAGLLIRMTDQGGRSLNFTWDGVARLMSMTDPLGGLYRYTYDANSNLSSVIYPDKSQRIYHYNEAAYINDGAVCPNSVGLPNALTGITDENGVRYAFFKYSCDGRAVSTEHVNGIDKFSFEYQGVQSSSPTTTETDPLGTVRTLQYAEILSVVRPTGTTQPAPNGSGTVSSSTAYDANGNIASRTDFNGITTTYTYDLTRNLETTRTEAAGKPEAHTITTTWHPNFRLPASITEPGLKTEYAYDSKGNLTQKILTDLVTNKTRVWKTTYSYSATGLLLSKVEDGPRTDVQDLTTYAYYPADATCTGVPLGCRGQLQQVTSPLGHMTRVSNYNASGQPLTITDPNGLVTTLAYDARQRLTSMSVGGEQTTYAYDRAGQLTRITQPNGAYLDYSYDKAHRLIQVKDQRGNTRQYTLDNIGNRTKEELSDTNGQLTRSQTRVYDALSRLQKLILPQ